LDEREADFLQHIGRHVEQQKRAGSGFCYFCFCGFCNCIGIVRFAAATAGAATAGAAADFSPPPAGYSLLSPFALPRLAPQSSVCCPVFTNAWHWSRTGRSK
jgi:hypothetical protein